MPIYEYSCTKCGHEFETLIRGDAQPQCPQCGGGELRETAECPFRPQRHGEVSPGCPRLRADGETDQCAGGECARCEAVRPIGPPEKDNAGGGCAQSPAIRRPEKTEAAESANGFRRLVEPIAPESHDSSGEQVDPTDNCTTCRSPPRTLKGMARQATTQLPGR